MRIGVDMGGTKIEAIALDERGEVLFRERTPTPRDDYAGTIDAIRNLVVRAEAATGMQGSVGIGIPGTLSPETGVVKNANSVWLIGHRFDQDLAKALGRPIRMANDANCFAISEAVDGAARDAEIVFGVIIGTGCGGGIVVNRRPLIGGNAIAGEWGHNSLPWPEESELPGPDCYCGKNGCIETWLSGPGLSRDYCENAGNEKSTESIVAAARSGDEQAEAALGRYINRMARALASIINVLDPDVIVLGGGLSEVDELYERVPPLLGAYVFSDFVRTPIVKNMHGSSSGVRGAAWLWPQKEV